MINPLPAIQAATVPSLSPGTGAAAPAIQVADRPQIPTSQDGADFARAAAAQGAPLDIQSSMPAMSSGIGASLAHQMGQIAQHLSSLAGNAPAPSNAAPAANGDRMDAAGPPGAKLASLNQTDTSAAVAQIEHAYMFAIETTMASRGSTESTKIFNTLLKGQ